MHDQDPVGGQSVHLTVTRLPLRSFLLEITFEMIHLIFLLVVRGGSAEPQLKF